MSKIFTMCFIENNNHLLLQKSIKKPFEGLWNAPGGKVEVYESPMEACIREIQEETGLEINHPNFRGIITVTNVNKKSSDLLMLFHAKDFSGDLRDSDEGEIAWIETENIYLYDNTPDSFTCLLPYILETESTITGKIIYSKKKMELFDVIL